MILSHVIDRWLPRWCWWCLLGWWWCWLRWCWCFCWHFSYRPGDCSSQLGLVQSFKRSRFLLRRRKYGKIQFKGRPGMVGPLFHSDRHILIGSSNPFGPRSASAFCCSEATNKPLQVYQIVPPGKNLTSKRFWWMRPNNKSNDEYRFLINDLDSTTNRILSLDWFKLWIHLVGNAT